MESEYAFLAIAGRAFVMRDSAKSKKIGRTSDATWFPDGPEDTNVRVLRTQPITAELWDGPSRAAVVDFICAQESA